MQEEMNEEWMELAVSNIHKLIPDEWMPRINEILPKILNIVKIGIKKSIKSTAESLGNNKIFLFMNAPYIREDNSITMVPTIFKIDKSQLGPSVLNVATGNYELTIKSGEVPEITFSLFNLAEKINEYKNVQDIIRDVKNGNFLSSKDINYTGSKPDIDTAEQSQLGARVE